VLPLEAGADPGLCYNRSAFANPELPLPDFSAFAGLRYDCNAAGADLEALTAPPYDVIDEERRAALEAESGYNAVRLLLPHDHEQDGDRYERAARALADWEQSGALAIDSSPRFYTYRMEFRDPHGAPRHTRGVIGALTLPEAGDTSLLPHERTAAKAKSDRLALLRATRANVDPIWGLSLASGLTKELEPDTVLATCTDADGVVHELGAIDDPARIEKISALIGEQPIVLADGHHRFETACNYRNELRAAGETVTPDGAGAIMMLVVELDDDELDIEPIHRLLDVPEDVDLISRLEQVFDVVEFGDSSPAAIDALQARMARDQGLGIVNRDSTLYVAIPHAAARAEALADEDPSVAQTDTAVVEALVMPLVKEATWRYWHDAQAVAAQVEKGEASYAILCSPVSVALTRAAAANRVRMPQKTTFFTPKPLSGMVFRKLS
jgi:uncharacterized protein (DUF1015 family)